MSMSEVAGRKLAFIGLGQMGTPMARRLVEAGLDVRGFDLADAARAQLVEAGGSAASSAADAVNGAHIVVLMLPDSNAVEAVLQTPEVIDGLGRGTMVIDMSSSEPDRTRRLAASLGGRGVALIDAPVSGGVARARTGELAIMVGGDDDVVGRAEDVLTKLGRVFRAGPVGAGHAVKALNNLMSATHLLVTSEAILTAEAFGLDPRLVLGIVNASSGRSGSTENKWPNFIIGGTYDSGFALRLMLKDMRIAAGLAHHLAVPSELTDRAVELWSEAADALSESADHTEIARWLEGRMAGERDGAVG